MKFIPVKTGFWAALQMPPSGENEIRLSVN